MLAGRTVATGWLGTAELPLTDRPAGATRVTAYFGTAETPLPGGEVADLSSASYQAAGPVSVTLPSTAPVARPDSYTTPEGRTLTVAAPGVLGNDTNADTASLVSGPATGRLDAASGRVLQLRPARRLRRHGDLPLHREPGRAGLGTGHGDHHRDRVDAERLHDQRHRRGRHLDRHIRRTTSSAVWAGTTRSRVATATTGSTAARATTP